MFVCTKKKGCNARKKVYIKTGEEEIIQNHNSKCKPDEAKKLKMDLEPKSMTETKTSEDDNLENNLKQENNFLRNEIKKLKKQIAITEKKVIDISGLDVQQVLSRKRDRQIPAKRVDVIKSMPSWINCCGKIHRRSQFRRHIDFCKTLNEELFTYCFKCRRMCAMEGEFHVENKEYFVIPHKCCKPKLKKNSLSKSKSAISKRRYRARYPTRCRMKHQTYKQKINTNPFTHVLSLWETCCILFYENLIRNSKLIKPQIEKSFALGKQSFLIDIDEKIMKKAMFVSGCQENLKSYINSILYYKSFLYTDLHHLVKLKGTKMRARPDKKYKTEFDSLDENIKYKPEVFKAYLKATMKTGLYDLITRIEKQLSAYSIE